VVITYDAASGSPRPEGGTWGTRGSYTLRVTAPDFTAEHLTIENAFDYAANAARAEGDPARLASPQAVALMTDSASDRAVFRDVRIRGAQDTLFPNAGRHYFHGCVIEGHVDFVFGAGTAVFEECEMVSLDRGRPDNGYVTAASTALAQPYGFVFLRSRLRKGSPAMVDGSVALGRPWHPSADRQAVGSVAFIDCWMDGHVSARGWEPMSSVDSTGTRVWFQPEDARLFEYRSTGPGAVASPSRRQLTDAQAAAYAPELVLAGWRPGPATDGR
jgi:pectinesterase